MRTPTYAVLAIALAAPPVGAEQRSVRADGVGPAGWPSAAAGFADVIVLGKVTKVDLELEEVHFPAVGKVRHKVAVVRVTEALLGAKGLDEVRVGFPAENALGFDRSGDDIKRGPEYDPDPKWAGGADPLDVGAEGCFCLVRHPTADFYAFAANGRHAPLLKDREDHDAELTTIRKIAAALKDPVSALSAKSKGDRVLAVRVLYRRYRVWDRPGDPAEQPVPADEAKAFFLAMADLPWTDGRNLGRSVLWTFTVDAQAAKVGAFLSGEPANQDKASAKFLKENADKLTLTRLVPKK